MRWGGALIYNIDTFVEPGILKPLLIKGDGFIPCFKGKGNHWSFVNVDENHRAIEVQEKTRISDYCSVGMYYFSSAQIYKDIYCKFYSVLDGAEQYIAPMYNLMIHDGYPVFVQDIPAQKVHVLGTPEELNEFEHSFDIETL